MRARGELTDEQFEQAKLLLQKDGPKADPPKAAANNAASPSPPVKPKKKAGCLYSFLWLIGLLVGLFVLMVIVEMNKSPEQQAKEAAERARQEEIRKANDKKEAEEAKVKAAQKAIEDREKMKTGMHCLSGWDGSHRGLVNAVKAQMRDPDSFEHIETRISPVDAQGHNAVIMQFRAKNGFGGMNVGIASGVISNTSCSLVSWQLLAS